MLSVAGPSTNARGCLQNVRVSEPLLCPICLGEAVAGRITRCGHAYCWPCLLHYFALSEDSQRPCPICFQPIDKRHLRR